MFLTAHHVHSPTRDVEGVNAYCFLHGSYVWGAEPPPGIPEDNPGTLVHSSTPVPPPGNRVRAYVDIIASDETPTPEIIQAALGFLDASASASVPWQRTVGRCTFRFNLDASLEPGWRDKFKELLSAALRVRRPA